MLLLKIKDRCQEHIENSEIIYYAFTETLIYNELIPLHVTMARTSSIANHFNIDTRISDFLEYLNARMTCNCQLIISL